MIANNNRNNRSRDEDSIEQDLIRLVKEAMESGISKEDFKDFIKMKEIEKF